MSVSYVQVSRHPRCFELVGPLERLLPRGTTARIDPNRSVELLQSRQPLRQTRSGLGAPEAVVHDHRESAMSCHSRRPQGFVIGQLASAAQSEKLR
jgi:hypothetical protein